MKFSAVKKSVLMISLVSALSSCGQAQKASQPLTSAIIDNANNMDVRYQVISNTAELTCDPNRAGGDCYQSQLILSFSQPLPEQGWSIYFSHLAPIQSLQSEHFRIERINGDLHKLTAKSPIKANHEYILELKSDFWMVSKSDILPDYFFAFDDNNTAIIKATRESLSAQNGLAVLPHAGSFDSDQQIKRNALDDYQAQNAESVYQRNQQIIDAASAVEQQPVAIVPRVDHQQLSKEQVDLSKGISLSSDHEFRLSELSEKASELGLKTNQQGITTLIQQDDAIAKQAYRLTIAETGIEISASDDAGAFYALVTLAQMAQQSVHVTTGQFSDSPRYAMRSVHLDVARNFRSAEFVKTLIKQMAKLKLNTLHLHLADDEGWRLAINDLPELTSIGGYRCYDPAETSCLMPQLGSGPNRETPANGYYTTEQYIDILRTAQRHHVQIIPSLDMPGHSRAAIVSMLARYKTLSARGEQHQAEQFLLTEFADTSKYSSVQHYNDNTLNPCIDSTYRFVDKVLEELISVHQQAQVPLKRYHIGADETAGAWQDSPACQTLINNTASIQSSEDLTHYFVAKVAHMVQQKGVMPAGWSDGMGKLADDPSFTQSTPMQVNVWHTLMAQGQEEAYQFAEHNWNTILSFPDVFYFDFPYAVSGDEPGYYWASRATDAYKVFQFMGNNMEQLDQLWRDRMNNTYQAKTRPESADKVTFEGIQAHLWSEVVRHDSVAQYMYFPRLISFADKAWHMPEWESMAKRAESSEWQQQMAADWRQLGLGITRNILPQLQQQNINFRVAPPGGMVEEGVLKMNHLYPSIELEYRDNQGQWQHYLKPVPVSLPVSLRARVPGSERTSSTFIIQ